MALSTLSGSLPSTSSSPAPSSNSYVKGPVDTTTTPEKRLVDRGPVLDTVHRDNVLNIDRFGESIKQLQRYIGGTPVVVTYYSTVVNNDYRTADNNPDTESIHQLFTRINNFEVRFSDQLQYSYANEDNTSTVSGTVITYAGFVPKVGDFFLYEIEPGKVGQFKVTAVNRMSIRRQTCHEITVSLNKLVDQTQIDQFETTVVDVLFFDMNAFMGDKSILLHTSDVVLLRDIDEINGILKRYYWTTFFDESSHRSFIRPDGLYDPYILDFIKNLYEFSEMPQYPTTLIEAPKNHTKSYWAGLMHPNAMEPGFLLWNYTTDTCEADAQFTRMTSLLNRNYIQLCADTEVGAQPYISVGLRSLDGDEQTEFDKLVRLYFEHRQIDPTQLLLQAQGYASLEPMDQFYRIPIFMFLLSLLKQIIFSGSGKIAYGQSVEYLPTEYEFTKDDVVNDILIVAMDNKALGVIDEAGVQWMLPSTAVRYLGGNIHVDLSTILQTRHLDEIPGTWKLVLTGNVKKVE